MMSNGRQHIRGGAAGVALTFQLLMARRIVCLAVAMLLVAGLSFTPGVARADEITEAAAAQQVVDGAQAVLEDAETRVQMLASDYESLKKEADSLQGRIDETAAKALESQQAVIEGRSKLGTLAAAEYWGRSTSSLVTLVLESTDFAQLLRNLSYMGSLMQYQADEIEAQRVRSEQFNALVDNLNVQKDAQDKKLAEAEAKRVEAQQVATSATAQLQNAQDDQAARLATLKQAAEQMAEQGEVTGPVEVEDANTVDRPSVIPPETVPEPDPNPTPPAPTPDPGGGGAGGGSDIGWSSGVASAYGGSTDPYTPNPGTTATGAVCDDWSMGVAVPMAWPNYWRYYGRTVEISYNGKTVFATVNDCGGMGGGSRSLDLQPGVWKAFGYSSCTDWGVRTVSYRFL